MELERKRAALVRGGYAGMVILVTALALRYFWMLLAPFFLGLFIAYLLRPVTAFVCRHSGMGGRGAAMVAVIGFYGLLAAVLWLLGLLLFVQLENLGEVLPEVYREQVAPALGALGETVQRALHRLSPALGEGTGRTLETAAAALESAVASASAWAMEGITRFFAGLPGLLLATAFTILSSILICGDYDTVTRFVMRQIPARFHGTVVETRGFLCHTLANMLRAYLLLTLCTFALLSLGLWVLGVGPFFAAAAMIALLDLLPVLGSGVVLVPWGIYGIVAGDTLAGVGMLALWGVITAARQVLEPRIVGKQIGLHPLATLCAMYAGWKLAGFLGVLAAPVLCLLLKYLNDKGVVSLYKK